MQKPIVIGVVVVIALAAIAYFGSVYLVSRLDGTGGVTASPEPTPAGQRYSSEDGLTFYYPERYELSSRTEGNAERQWDVLVLLEKTNAPVGEGTEGPPAITVGVYPNTEGYTLEQWIKGDARSNFKLSTDQKLTPTTVGGLPALAYGHTGLYETDAVAVAAYDKIFVFSAGWLERSDRMRQDFQDILKTVKFTQ
jgi:hypothetical protein